jgi:hypothetical protein
MLLLSIAKPWAWRLFAGGTVWSVFTPYQQLRTLHPLVRR